MVTFAVRVPPGEDVAAAELALIDTAEHWVLLARLSGTFDPMPAVVVEATEVPEFVPTGEMVPRGLGLVPESRLRVVTLLEAKVEVDE